MKLSEYIAALQRLQEENGDLDVVHRLPYGPFGAFDRKVALPKVRPVKAKVGREQYEKIGHHDDPLTGESVFVL